jgi:hypothetical protein
MKQLLLFLSLAALGPFSKAADVELLQQQASDVYNLKLGEASDSMNVAGLSVLDQQGDRSVISLGDAISLQTAGVQISGVLFAILPPDDENQVTALIMCQATPDGQQPETDQSLNQLVLDIIAHNAWTDCEVQIRPMNPGDTIPAGTQFWVGSSSKSLMLNGPTVCVADNATAP